MPKPPATQNRPARPIDSFKAQLRAALPTVARMLPTHVTPEKFESQVVTAVANKPELLECDASSLLKAVAEAAELGLSLNPHLGEAWILKVWNKRLNGGSGGYEAQLRPGFIGLMKLARQSGDIKQIVAGIRYENDDWQMTLVPPNLRHEAADGERGEKRGAYCWWKLATGEEQFEYIDAEQIDKIRQRSNSKNREGELVGPWVTDEDEMWRKTAVRRARKYMPQSPTLEKFHEAVARDNELDLDENDVPFTDVTVPETPPPAADAGRKQADALADRVAAKPQVLAVPEGFDGDPDYEGWKLAAMNALKSLAAQQKKAWLADHAAILQDAPKEVADAVRSAAG